MGMSRLVVMRVSELSLVSPIVDLTRVLILFRDEKLRSASIEVAGMEANRRSPRWTLGRVFLSQSLRALRAVLGSESISESAQRLPQIDTSAFTKSASLYKDNEMEYSWRES